MKKFLLLLFFFIPIPIVAQTYLPKIKELHEWKKKEISPELESYQPIYEDINITVELDFYRPHLSELLFLVEKRLLDFDLTQVNEVGINFSLPKNIPTNNSTDTEIIFTTTKKKFTKVKSGINSNVTLDLNRAKEILLKSLKQPKKEIIQLWLAWVFYLEGNFEPAQQFLDKIYHNPDLKIALPAEYLQTMLYLKNEDYHKVSIQIKNWHLYYPQVPIPHNLQLASVLALAKNSHLTAVQENLNFLKTLKKNKDFRISQSFNLLQAWSYYNHKKYASTYRILSRIKTKNLNKEENFQLRYGQAWSALFAKKKMTKKTKNILIKGSNVKNNSKKNKKEELDYLLFLDNLMQTKNPTITLLKKIKKNSFYPYGVVTFLSQKRISKKQKEILYQEYIEIRNPNLIFYYNAQKADYLSKKADFSQALHHYFKARNASLLLSENSQQNFLKMNFNVGLIYLKQKKYTQAERVLNNQQTNLQTNSQEQNYRAATLYYLSVIYYFQKKADKILNLTPINNKKSKFYKEQFFFQAWANDRIGNTKASIKQIKLAQRYRSSNNQALTISLLFKQKKYKKIIQLHNSKKNHTYDSDKFYIAALLKLRKEKKALTYLKKIKKQNNILYADLYLKVWLANKLYKKAIDFYLQKLQQKNILEIPFYEALSFAYHQLEKWDASIKPLEIIIAINFSPESNKNAADNIFLNLLYSSEKKHIQHKNNIIANEKRNSLSLWGKVVLLAEEHKRQLQFRQALKIYQNYLKKNTFQKASIQLLNQEILYLQSYWNLCVEYGKIPFFQETLTEKMDRRIASNYCSIRQNKKIQFPIPQKLDYRKNSWLFLQALSEKQTTNLIDSKIIGQIKIKKLNLLEQQEYRLLQTESQIQSQKFTAALKNLHQLQNYIYFPANYRRKLFLQTQIYLHLEKKKLALNSLAKLIYSPLDKKTRMEFILTAIEILIEQGWREEIQLFFGSIQSKNLTEANQERYNKIQQWIIEN